MARSRYPSCLLVALALGCAEVPSDEPSLQALLDRHTRAVGGRQAIEAVRSLRYHLRIAEPAFQAEAIYVVDRGGRMRIDVLSEGQRVFTEAFDGEAGWQLGPDEVHGRESGADGSAALWHGTQSPLKLLGLHELAGLGHRVEDAGSETVDGVRYHRLRVTLSDGWENLYYLDPESYRIVRNRDQRALHPDLDPTRRRIEDRLGDYRPVAGTLKPFHGEQVDLETGEVLQTTVVTGIEVNPALEAGLFRRP